jgi:hypothetical protein
MINQESTNKLTDKDYIQYIYECISNKDIITKVRQYFSRLSVMSAKLLLMELFNGNGEIELNKIKVSSVFLRDDNTRIITKENNIQIIDPIIYDKIKKFIKSYIDSIPKEDEISEDKLGLKVNKHWTYLKYLEKLCNDEGMCEYDYNFQSADLDLSEITDTNAVQRTYVRVITKPIQFSHPIKLAYTCDKEECCNYQKPKKYNFYLKNSTNNKHICNGTVKTLNDSLKACNKTLSTDENSSVFKTAYYYKINFPNSNDKHSYHGISFKELEPGLYDVVLFKVNSITTMPTFHILDFQKSQEKHITLPEISPNEHYIETLRKTCDEFIKKEINYDIGGLHDIKEAVIIQAIAEKLNYELIYNICVTGDSGTGKTLAIDTYNYLLYNFNYLSTTGNDISSAGLRGSDTTISLFNKTIPQTTIGHLGTYKNIYIDEAGNNLSLIDDLKNYAHSPSYAYCKHGGTGSVNDRTAHITLTQNIPRIHRQYKYRKEIKDMFEKYKNQIEGDEKSTWDPDIDLYLPIDQYESNKLLQKCIYNVRKELANNETFWVDGYEDSLYNRFPFYFLIKSNKNAKVESLPELKKSKNYTSKYKSTLGNFEMASRLKNNLLDTLINKIKESNIPLILEHDKFDGKVDSLIKQYNLEESRDKKFLFGVLNILRLISLRPDPNEQDFNKLCKIIEVTHQQCTENDFVNYEMRGYIDTYCDKPGMTGYSEQVEKESKKSDIDNTFDTFNSTSLPEDI